MSVCCQEPIKKMVVIKPRHLENYRFNTITMLFNISKPIMEDILRNIFAEFCCVSMIGYESNTGKYWCKTFDNNTKSCSLYIELEILEKNDGRIVVRLYPISGTRVLVDNFASDFKESVDLYTTSPFFRGCFTNGL